MEKTKLTRKKRVQEFSKKKKSRDSILLPTSVFRDRSVSVLEAITEYLKEKESMTYHEIAVLLNRDDRTIWTCYNRAKVKRK